jgi:hypothetical protein
VVQGRPWTPLAHETVDGRSAGRLTHTNHAEQHKLAHRQHINCSHTYTQTRAPQTLQCGGEGRGEVCNHAILTRTPADGARHRSQSPKVCPYRCAAVPDAAGWALSKKRSVREQKIGAACGLRLRAGWQDGQTGQSGQTSVDDCFLPSGTCTAGAGTVMGLPTGYGYLRHPAGSFRLASMNTEPRASTTWCGQALR